MVGARICRDLGHTLEALVYLESYIEVNKINLSNQNNYLLKKREALILRQMEKYQESNAKLAEFSSDDAKLFIAQNYFLIGDYDKSRRISEEIISSCIENEKVLNAREIIFSIENNSK